MKKRMIAGVAVSLLVGSSHAAIIIDGSFAALASPPTVSNTDLAQSAVANPETDITAVSTDTLGTGTRRLGLFNGAVGDDTQNTNEDDYVRVNNGSTLTVNFDTSVNTLGYNLTGITSVFNWADRADQGFTVDLGFVGGGTGTLITGALFADQTTSDGSEQYSIVTVTESGGGTLFSDTVNLNSGGAIAGSSVTATGVQSITFTFTNLRNPSVAGEIDIFGTASIPEPATLGMVALFGGGILFIRRRFMI